MRFGLVVVALLLLIGTWALPAAAQGGRRRPVRGKEPKVGDRAPDFALVLLEDDKEEAGKADASADASSSKDTSEGKQKVEGPKKVRLSSFKGRKPVVLLFSSYT